MFQLPCWQNGGRAHKHRWGQVRNTNSGAVETWLETHKKAKFQGKYRSKSNKNTKGIDWYPCFQVQMRHVGEGKGERRPSHLSLDQVSSWLWWSFLVKSMCPRHSQLCFTSACQWGCLMQWTVLHKRGTGPRSLWRFWCFYHVDFCNVLFCISSTSST